MIAHIVVHAEPQHSCAGCRHLIERRWPGSGLQNTRWCHEHVTPFARCGLYETDKAVRASSALRMAPA